jgi:hypothetical protein
MTSGVPNVDGQCGRMRISEVIDALVRLHAKLGDIEVQAVEERPAPIHFEFYTVSGVGYDKYEADGDWIAELEIVQTDDD